MNDARRIRIIRQWRDMLSIDALREQAKRGNGVNNNSVAWWLDVDTLLKALDEARGVLGDIAGSDPSDFECRYCVFCQQEYGYHHDQDCPWFKACKLMDGDD